LPADPKENITVSTRRTRMPLSKRRPAWHRTRMGLIAVLILGLTLQAGLISNRSVADSSTSGAVSAPEPAAGPSIELPHTDGSGLQPKPSAFTKLERAQFFAAAQLACAGPCVTPFGAVLGVADGAEGRSNCVSTCIRLEYSYLDPTSGIVSVYPDDPQQEQLQYVGVTYQCVEYARKWWMKNLGLTFGSIDSAYEILYLTEGKNLRTQQAVPLARSLNGTAQRPPRRGDLVVYAPDRTEPEWRHGHVAVVVAVDLAKGSVALAEENYDNRPWQNPQAFARQIQLFEIGGRYTLLDVPMTAHQNSKGGRIAGWLYPWEAP